MNHIEGYEWIIYSLSLFSVMLLGSLSGNTFNKNFKNKTLLVKKIFLGVFIITSIYWIATFPIVSSYNSFSDKSEYPSNISAEKQSDYITENHRQIESLERKLKETKDDLEAVTERINLLLQFIMYGLIYFGANWIFTSNKKDLKENQENLSLNL